MVRCSPEALGRTDRDPLLVDLALQGGGSHGALTWGVIERSLEETSLRIESITGTSAGAKSAAALACGDTVDGVKGAKAGWRISLEPKEQT
jgi:NTE family protein